MGGEEWKVCVMFQEKSGFTRESKQVFCPVVLVGTLRGKRDRQPGHQNIRTGIHDLQGALVPVQIRVDFRLPSFVLCSVFYKKVKTELLLVPSGRG